MSTSSAQPDLSTISTDTITISLPDTSTYYGSDTITLSPGISSFPTTSYTISTTAISGLTTAQVSTLSSINIGEYSIKLPEDWVNCFPDFDRVQKMCKEYPGLKIAYEKFVTTYKLVKDHYDTPEDQRPKP